MTRTELDIQTGESRQIASQAYLLGNALVFVDDGDPVPVGAVLASSVQQPEAQQQPPEQKLAAFLAANPDVLALVQGSE